MTEGGYRQAFGLFLTEHPSEEAVAREHATDTPLRALPVTRRRRLAQGMRAGGDGRPSPARAARARLTCRGTRGEVQFLEPAVVPNAISHLTTPALGLYGPSGPVPS